MNSGIDVREQPENATFVTNSGTNVRPEPSLISYSNSNPCLRYFAVYVFYLLVVVKKRLPMTASA
ncbi:hypothetical protein GI584_14500 [Gracilibacillus salitolerans]|uniref:Uncharacterized protein n=1 Tax=Gracilibacillus salitolerans TaxID=2663022 RepID=A0A5Q2TMG0_9BACI|nr:hypothetical protein GI584_14500 [Gracilibacillus salitolerans]